LLLKSMLDDDSDMWDMHLSAKEAQRTAAQEVAARMMAEVNAMAEQAAHMPTLEKVRVYGFVCVILVGSGLEVSTLVGQAAHVLTLDACVKISSGGVRSGGMLTSGSWCFIKACAEVSSGGVG